MLPLFVSCALALAAVTSADDVADVAEDALTDDALHEDAPSAPSIEAPVVAEEQALPEPDDSPDAPAEEDPWPWATTIGSGIGVVPGGVVGVIGTVVGGLGLAMVASGISQGGSGICLAFLGAMGLVLAVPIFIVTSVLMPIGVIVGALLGGAIEERFAWPTAVGALAGFIPAAAAAASTVVAYLLLLNASTGGTQNANVALMSMLGALGAAMMFAIATGPVAIAGGAAVESLLLPPEDPVVDEAPAAPTKDGQAPPPTPTEEAPREEAPTTDESTPPPLLDPAMRF